LSLISDKVISKSWRRKPMSTKISCFALSVLLLALSFTAQAQQTKNIPRIGYLGTRLGPGANEEVFRDGLRSLGYIEGQTITIEWRYAQEKFDRLPELASELVRLKVDHVSLSDEQIIQLRLPFSGSQSSTPGSDTRERAPDCSMCASSSPANPSALPDHGFRGCACWRS
jgi:hypothetical protein